MRFPLHPFYGFDSTFTRYDKFGSIARNAPQLTERTITITERRTVEVMEGMKPQSELEKLFSKPANGGTTRKWFTENIAVMEETFK
ncbi:MAG: hypothetical protein ACTHQM_15615 [Thermoanaerobaculia bacterium]